MRLRIKILAMKLFTLKSFIVFTVLAFVNLLFVEASASSMNLNVDEELTCTVTNPSISSSNGCCTVDASPYSNGGQVEWMWAKNNNGSIQAVTGWSTNQQTTFCPTDAGYYRICSRVVGCSSIHESDDAYCEPQTCGTLDGIYIYDQTNDQAAYGPIQNNEEISINDLPENYYLVAQTSGNIESVTWWVDGYTATENVVLYTFPSGAENDNNWSGSIGIHNIDVNAYNSDGGNGEHCGQIWLTFEIVPGIQPPTSPSCDSGDFIWTNNIDITSLSGSSGIPDADLRMKDGGITVYPIPGPYPSAFNSPVTLSINEAISYDAYLNRVNVSQPNEQWKLVFKKNGNVVYETEYTQDTPDNVITGEWIGSLDQNFTLPNGTDEILIVHYEDPTYGNGSIASSSNSVAPSSICISYVEGCENSIVLDQWNESDNCEICEDSFTSNAKNNNGPVPNPAYGGLEGDEIDFSDPICTPNACIVGVYITFNVAATDFEFDQDANDIQQLDINYPIEINDQVIGTFDPTELPYTCNICEPENSKTIYYEIDPSSFNYNYGGQNELDLNFYEYGVNNNTLQDICVANVQLQFITGECAEECDLSVLVTGENEICTGNESLLTANVSNESDCSIGCEYDVSPPNRCGTNAEFVFYIADAPGGTQFTSNNPTFIEYSNGTAKFTANATNGTDNLEIDITYSEKTTISPLGSPKDNICETTDTSNWTYYQTTSGIVISENHGTFTVSRKGPAFQLGNTAMHIAPGFGASGWIYLNGGDGTYTDGDVNIKLNEDCETVNGSSGITYLWSNGESTSTISVSEAGTYSVVVTDCAGCTATNEITISEKCSSLTGAAPSDTTVECDANLPSDEATFDSDCSFTSSMNETTILLDCGYQLIRAWTAIDECDNELVLTQTITILDDTAPTGNAPADVTIECSETLPADQPTFTDNCDEYLDITSDESQVDLDCGYQIIRTWTAMDDCGNSTSVSQTITVIDTVNQ